jgi:hypothetical protein
VAEEEVTRDLAVRPADRDEPEDLELAPRQPAVLELAGGPSSQPSIGRLAERLELGRRLKPEGACLELPEGPVRVEEPVDSRLSFTGGGEGHAGSDLNLRALEGRVDVAQKLERVLEPFGSRVGVALEQGHLAEHVRESRQRVGAAEARSPGREGVRAGPHESSVAASRCGGRDRAEAMRVEEGDQLRRRVDQLPRVRALRRGPR